MISLSGETTLFQEAAKILTDDKQPIHVAAVKLFELQCWAYGGGFFHIPGRSLALLAVLQQMLMEGKLTDRQIAELIRRYVAPYNLGLNSVLTISHRRVDEELTSYVKSADVACNIIDFSVRFSHSQYKTTRRTGTSTMARQIVNLAKSYQPHPGKTTTQDIWKRVKRAAPLIYVIRNTDFEPSISRSLGQDLMKLAARRADIRKIFCRYNEVVRVLSDAGYDCETVEVEPVMILPLKLDPFPADVVEAITNYKAGLDSYRGG